MKNYTYLFLQFKVWIMATAVCLMAIQSKAVELDVSTSTDVSSAYIWRGILFNDEGVIQPSLDLSHENGLAFNVWGNFDLGTFDGVVDTLDFSEIDLTLSYAFPIETLDLSVGWIEYLFPQGGGSTREIYTDVGIEIVEGLEAGITLYYDFDQVDGFYGTLGGSYSVTVSDELSLDFSTTLGASDDDFSIGRDPGLHDWNFRLDASYSINEQMGVGAFIGYWDNFDDDVLPEQDTNFFGGANFSFSF